MVKPDETKVKNYQETIQKKLAECTTDEEREAYKQYCIAECRKWDLDVNYHKAVENVFGYSHIWKRTSAVIEDVPF